jgi:hypothetical protein
MPKEVEHNGKIYEFPDEAGNDAILSFLQEQDAPKSVAKPSKLNFAADLGKKVFDTTPVGLAKKLVVDPVVEGFKGIRDKGEISPLATTLGGLVGSVGGPWGSAAGAGVGSLIGQTAEQMVKGNTPNPVGIMGNAAVDAGIDFGLGKVAGVAGKGIKNYLDFKAEGSSSPLRETFFKAFFPAKNHPENIAAAQAYANKIPTSVGESTGNPLAQWLEQGPAGARRVNLAKLQQEGIDTEVAKFDKKFLGGRKENQSSLGLEAQKIVARNTGVPRDQLGDPSTFFQRAFNNIDEAKRLKKDLSMVSSDDAKVMGAAYWEDLKERAVNKAKRTIDYKVIINDLLDNDSPARVFLHDKQRQALVQFSRQLENVGSASKAALKVDNDGNLALGLTVGLLTAGRHAAWSKILGVTEGAVLLLGSPMSRMLMNPKYAKLATRATKVKPDSPEGKFISKTLLLGMKGQQVRLQIPNAGIFNASINEQGRIEVEGAQ